MLEKGAGGHVFHDEGIFDTHVYRSVGAERNG